MAETIGAQSPTAYVNEARRQIQQAHRERPDQHVPQGEQGKNKESSELPAAQAVRKPEEGAGREPYNPASRQAQVLVQELAAQQAAREKKLAETRRRLTRRSGPYKSRRELDPALVAADGTIKLSV